MYAGTTTTRSTLTRTTTYSTTSITTEKSSLPTTTATTTQPEIGNHIVIIVCKHMIEWCAIPLCYELIGLDNRGICGLMKTKNTNPYSKHNPKA